MTAEKERRLAGAVNRRIAHQVDAVRVRPGAKPHAARIHQRHEYHAYRFQLLIQRIVPMPPLEDAGEKRQQYSRTYALDPVYAAEESDYWNVRIWIADADDVQRKIAAGDGNLAQLMDGQSITMLVNELFQSGQFGQWQAIFVAITGDAHIEEMMDGLVTHVARNGTWLTYRT